MAFNDYNHRYNISRYIRDQILDPAEYRIYAKIDVDNWLFIWGSTGGLIKSILPPPSVLNKKIFKKIIKIDERNL